MKVLSKNMKKKSKNRTDFNLLKNVSLFFGVDMMSRSKVKFKIVTSYLFVLCNICWIIVANIYNLSYSSRPHWCIQKSVPIAISRLEQILGLVTTALIYFQVLYHKKTISSIDHKLRSSDSILSNLNVQFSYKKFNILIKLLLVIAFILKMVVFAVLCIHYGIQSFEEVLLKFFVKFHPVILIYLMAILDAYLCWLVRIKLRALKLLLSELCEFKDTIGDKSNWKVSFIEENPKIFFTDLIKISEVYEILYEIVGNLNSAFGLSCLCSIAFECISLTCHVFLLFKAATGLTDEGEKMEILAQVLWILLFLAPLMLLIFVYYSTVLEANIVSMVLHETVAGKRIDSSSMQLEMDLISLQLLHQQPYFTACGFFNIDMTLAYAIIGAVTTYLVILLQFNSE